VSGPAPEPDVVVIGRAGCDLPPDGIGVPLSAVRSFARHPGGFGCNIAIGLARLGVRASLLAAVGDDGHGKFVQEFLAGEGVDTAPVRVARGVRTPLAFYEAFPPDDFPVTFYPTPAYWALEASQFSPRVLAAPIWLISATAFAHEPSRSILRRAIEARRTGDGPRTIVLDLDWRPTLWDREVAAVEVTRGLPALARTVIGSEDEFTRIGVDPRAISAQGRPDVFLKRGPLGAAYLARGEEVAVPPVPVQTRCGIGSGDAFAAAVVEGMVMRRPAPEILARANAAGALLATRLECAAAMPTRAELLEVLP
jgi:5-dehydro-2-deoxygluconokinase